MEWNGISKRSTSMHRHMFFCGLLLSLLSVGFLSAVTTHTAFSWNVQTVDDYGAHIGNGYTPIVVDSNNTAHIAYTRYVNETYYVVYASWNGTGFSTQDVAEGDAYSLALDSKNSPHILYGSFQEPLMYASWTGTEWVSQTVDANGAGFGMVALDSSGNPHIAYTDGATIKYAFLKGSSWSIQTVATYKLGDISFKLSFALDKNDMPYIMYSPASYIDYSQPIGIRAINVTLATYQNSNWNIQALSLPTPTGDYGNLVVDSKGRLHAIFTQHHFVSTENMTTLSSILYASWNGTAWNTQNLVSNISFNSMSLTLDSRDYPRIITSTGTYASWTGTSWNIQTANLDRVEGPCYLAVDANSNPYVSYRQSSPHKFNTNIIYATATEALVTEPMQPSSPASSDVLLLTVLAIVFIGTVTTVIIYAWNKKRRETR